MLNAQINRPQSKSLGNYYDYACTRRDRKALGEAIM